MAKKGITRVDVERAVATIEARGDQPTVTSVRQELGDTGSSSTIHRHLRDIRSEREAGSAAREAPPASIIEEMQRTTESLWALAQHVARQDIDTIRRSAHERVAQLEEDLEQAFGEVDAQRHALQRMSEQQAEADAEIERLRRALTESEAAREVIREEHRSLLVLLGERLQEASEGNGASRKGRSGENAKAQAS